MEILFNNNEKWLCEKNIKHSISPINTLSTINLKTTFLSNKQKRKATQTTPNNKTASNKLPCYVMGIVNLTPDSFFDGGKFLTPNQLEKPFLNKIEEMVNNGAHILDFGGVSTRPGAKQVSFEEEKNRILPMLKLTAKNFPNIKISIDTTNHEIANIACNEGAQIINDISAGVFSNEKIFSVAKKHNVPIIIMHMHGTPQTMQKNLDYENGVVETVFTFLKEKVHLLENLGISKNKIILDVGIGFGKNLEQNIILLKNQQYFLQLGCPLLVGASMKSMHQELVGANLKERLPSSLAVHLASVINGASFLRVHDVKATFQFLKSFFATIN